MPGDMPPRTWRSPRSSAHRPGNAAKDPLLAVGPETIWATSVWADRMPAWARASHDPDLRHADNFDELVRNTYKVLLTRGLLGCIVYSVDEETRHMLAGLAIPAPQAATNE